MDKLFDIYYETEELLEDFINDKFRTEKFWCILFEKLNHRGDSEYATYEAREEIIGSAIDDAESLLKENMLDICSIINNNNSGVILDLKCLYNVISKNELMENIVVNLVGSYPETQRFLEQFVATKFRNSLFWTSLLENLKNQSQEASGGTGASNYACNIMLRF